MDGLVLAPGEYSSVPPHFSDPNGTQGTWDGRKFLNIIRNGSAEQDNLRFQPWAQDKLAKLSFSFFDPPFILSTLLDRHGTGWYYRQTLSGLFRTFWTSLAADRTDRPVITASSSYMLMLLTFLGAAGALLWIWRKRKTLQWDILFFLGVSLFVSGTLVVFTRHIWLRESIPDHQLGTLYRSGHSPDRIDLMCRLAGMVEPLEIQN